MLDGKLKFGSLRVPCSCKQYLPTHGRGRAGYWCDIGHSALYSGDVNDLGGTSLVLSQAVNTLPAATTTKVATSGSPSFINQAVTFTAMVTSTYGRIPNGETVTFYDSTTQPGTGPIASGIARFTTSTLAARTHTIKARAFRGTGPLSANQASYNTSALTAGSHSITAVYGGTGNIKEHVAGVTEVVN
jgi:hypothetical protein